MSTIIERIKTIDDAYAAIGIEDRMAVIPFKDPKNERELASNSFFDSMVLVAALNEGWVPNYDDWDETKYSIWWDMRSEAAGGPGFSCNDCCCDDSDSFVGARLVFKSRELARYAGTQFAHVFKSFMTFSSTK